MSRFPFDPTKSIILCHVDIAGKGAEFSLKMAVDTGTTYTMIPSEVAVGIGCDPRDSQRTIEIIMGSGVEYVSLIVVPKVRAFGIEIKNLEVICHNLPAASPVEGLLGLNFLKKAGIIIDFSKNMIYPKK